MSTDAERRPFEQWVVIEIMGHQRLAGLASEEIVAGTPLLRVDVPAVEGVPAFTTYLGTGSIYRLTPVSEDIARRYAAGLRKRPVEPYELKALPAPVGAGDDDHGDEDDDLDDFGDE